MTNIINSLNWRYATKAYDKNKKLTVDQVNNLMESIRLSPSSYGLQAYKIIHVKNEELRSKLKEASWGQTQITDASELLVFTVPTNINENYIDDFIQKIADLRDISKDDLKGYSDMIKNTLNSLDTNSKIAWLSRQVYIALGFLLETAAIENIDATPMEGFDTQKYNEILELDKHNLTAVVVAALGYRSEDDDYASLKKFRRSKDELIIEK